MVQLIPGDLQYLKKRNTLLATEQTGNVERRLEGKCVAGGAVGLRGISTSSQIVRVSEDERCPFCRTYKQHRTGKPAVQALGTEHLGFAGQSV